MEQITSRSPARCTAPGLSLLAAALAALLAVACSSPSHRGPLVAAEASRPVASEAPRVRFERRWRAAVPKDHVRDHLAERSAEGRGFLASMGNLHCGLLRVGCALVLEPTRPCHSLRAECAYVRGMIRAFGHYRPEFVPTILSVLDVGGAIVGIWVRCRLQRFLDRVFGNLPSSKRLRSGKSP